MSKTKPITLDEFDAIVKARVGIPIPDLGPLGGLYFITSEARKIEKAIRISDSVQELLEKREEELEQLKQLKDMLDIKTYDAL